MAQDDPNVPGPSMPVAPQYRPQQPANVLVERPTSMTRAVQLMYVGAVLSVIGIVLSWVTKDELRDQIATTSPTLTPDEVESALTISLTTGTIVAVVGVGLWVWMAVANGAGRSWARVLATVLGGLGVLSAVLGLSTGTGVTIVMQLLSLVLAVAIVVLLWRPASSEYVRAQSARLA